MDKKTWKDINFYYIAYADQDKPSDWNVNSVNVFYLIINRVYGSISEKNGKKVLTIDKGDIVLKKYDKVFSGIKRHIKKIDKKEVNFNSNYDKIKFLSEDSLPLNKLIYFATLAIVIRCVFKRDGIFYPQVYLDDALCQI